MSWKRQLAKLGNLLSHGQRAADLEEEIRSHLQMEEQENLESGMPPDEAHYAALRRFGNVTLARERSREIWGWNSVETLWQDLRYGLRMLAKNPGFTAVAVLTLALGIGANTAIFSLMNALLLKSLPVKNPEQLVLLGSRGSSGATDYSFYYPVYRALGDQSQFFTDLAAFSPADLNVTVDGAPEPMVPGQLVSGGYFSVLGVSALAGRSITVDDDRVPGGHPVAMISYGYWKRHFALAPSVIGRVIQIDGTPFTIIGVTPPEFFGVEVGSAPDITVPLMMQPQVMPADENWLVRPINVVNWLRVVGRLRPGVTEKQALAGMGVVYQRIMEDEAAKIDAEWAESWRAERLVLAPGSRGLSGLRQQFSEPLFILMTLVGLVLLIACANVANLLLARAAARQKEIAVRLAIGAGRWRLIGQLLVESGLLAILSGACGSMLASWGGSALVSFLSIGRSAIVLDLSPDLHILLFTAAVALSTGLLFGLVPAMRASHLDLTPALKARAGNLIEGDHRLPVGKVLVIFQVALSLPLLIGAGLFVRSLRNLNSRDAGFNRESVLVVRVEPKGSDQKHGPTAIRLNHIYQDLQDRVEAIPGVLSASLAGTNPTTAINPNGTIRTPSGQEVGFGKVQVYPRYFRTLDLPILAGRDFTPADMVENAPYVAVISETLARRAFPNESPIGKRFECEGHDRPLCEIIGVVADARYSNLRGDAPAVAYQPFLQRNTGRGQMVLHVRIWGRNAGITERVRQEVQAIDKALPAFQIQTLATEVDAALIQERLVATLSSFFGFLALVLAAIGLYGLMAYAVAQRTNEIGIRMALGAQHGDVVRMVLRDTLFLVLLAVAIGVPVALAVARLASSLISDLLFGLKATDPVTIVLATVLMVAVALFAAYIPARRATKVDPMVALRYE